MITEKHATLSDLLLERWLRARNNDAIYWTTKHGDKLSIKKLSDEHLANAIDCMMKVYDDNIDDLETLLFK